jgi:hypothetical protein
MTDIIGFEPIVCHDDIQAMGKAKRLINGHTIERTIG